MNRKIGVTLIELVIVIMVLGIAAVGLLTLFNQVIFQTVKQESQAIATQLARGMMEELMLVDFYDLRARDQEAASSNPNWVDWVNKGYNYSIEVKSINPDYINAPTNNDLADSGAVVNFSNFLRVKVSVWRQNAAGARLCPDIVLYTIVTPYRY